MNKLIYSTGLLLVLFFSAHGQTLSELDTSHGFKEFKLGDSLEKWKSEMTYNRTWDDGGVSYVYNGSLGRKLFNLNVIDIELKFFKTKLVGIYLTTQFFLPTYKTTGKSPEIGYDEYISLTSKFESLFGVGVHFPSSGKGPDYQTMWEGKTTVLFVNMDYQGIHDGSRAFVIVTDKIFDDLNLKSGF